MITGAAPLPAAGAYLVWVLLAGAAAVVLRFRRRRRRRWQVPLLVVIGVASLVAFAGLSWGRATPFGDFDKAYYPAGRLLWTDPSRLYACEPGNLCFVNLPIVAALFTPLSLLPLRAAHLVFAGMGLVAVAWTMLLLVREQHAQEWKREAIVLLVALNGPLLYSLRLGNLTHVLLPVLVAAFACLVKRRDAAGGSMLAALAIVKPPFLLFLPYLVVRRRYRASAAFVLTGAAVTAASVVCCGMGPHRVWLTELIAPFAQGSVGAYNVQSVSGMLTHLVRPSDLTNWMPVPIPLALTVVKYGLVASLTWLVARRVRGARGSAALTWTELSGVLVLMLLVSPLTWTHYYAFCLIPLAGLVAASGEQGIGSADVATRAGGSRRLACVAALVSAPVVLWLPGTPWLGAVMARVLISHYVIGGVALLGWLTARNASARAFPLIVPFPSSCPISLPSEALR